MSSLRPTMTLWVALTLLVPVSDARAELCGNVGGQVECLDAVTLVWCDGGKLETVSCPDGEICTSHDAFDGGYGCVSLEDTACGDIPLEGLCTSANAVVWCNDEGEVKLKSCDEGTLCSWDNGESWYDCLPATMQTFPQDADSQPMVPWDTSLDSAVYDGNTGSAGDLGPMEDTLLHGEPDEAPTPNVTPSASDDDGGEAISEGAGCAGSPTPTGWLFALGLLLLAGRRRTVAHDLDPGRAP